uniref:Anaphase-promoting complex subunit 4-like WD40 domain-containing protein n=1 Tax=Tetranychus urticae TaxID=32264 RepID=T1K9I8_TETUR
MRSSFFCVLSNRDPQDKIYRNDSSDMLREIDELWFHLLSCEDIYKLKHNALLNIDFMMSAVQSSSISYYRSVLELVRGKIIDWEVDLLYHMTKQSVNIVSQNTDQLSIEILLWLRPFAAAIADSTNSLFSSSNNCDQMGDKESHSNAINSKYLENLVRDTVNWCARYSGSLLIPINSWLHLPLPMQVSVISCPYAITRATLTNDHQNLIFCNKRSIHFFNLASKTLLKSVQGHRETITCLDISSSGRYLVTGSEDTSVILWEIDADGEIECNSRYSLGHHVAGVLCTAITHNEEYILSGSEIGAICVVRLDSGLLIGRLEHHRGMITCIKVNLEDDIFAAGSTDCSVSIWSLDTFCVLNQIFLPKAILHMDISMDSTFLMLALEDNKVHIRALTTGSEVHILQEHQSNSIVSYVKFAEDSSRAILGTGDGKLHIYDVHSAHLIQTLTSHQDMITSIISQPCDKYLVTCGTCKVIIWNFYPRKKVDSSLGASSGPVTNLYATLGNPNNYSSIMRRATLSLTAQLIMSIIVSNGSNMGVNSVCRSSVSRTTSNRTDHESSNKSSRSSSLRVKKFDQHKDPITCLAVSRDGTYAVTGSRDSLVKVWNLSSGETHATLSGHSAPITCVSFSPNGFFCVSGSEDKTVRVWSLTLGLKVFVYPDHSAAIDSVFVSTDSRRILSIDSQGFHRLWQADSGNTLVNVAKLTNKVTMFGNTVFAVGGKNDNSLRYWSVYEPDLEKSVSHSEPITCYTCTYDCSTIITGSQDMSLKVWEVSTGKLTQVLVGHEEPISCVSSAPMVQSMVVSGSQDCNLIVWDTTTGNVTFTLTGHTATILSVQLSIDGRVAVSASEDNTIMAWNALETGQRIALVDIHHTISSIGLSLSLNQIVVQLKNNNLLPIIKFHNNPAKTLDLPPPGTPSNEDKFSSHLKGFLTGSNRRLIGRGNLKREQSFDSFCWDQLHRGVSIDDFRKISALQQTTGSPLGSREHLATTGIIWDGASGSSVASGVTSVTDRNINRLLRLSNKPAGPKQKMLKKQQSMFAFFPEHSPPPVTASTLVSGSAIGPVAASLRGPSPLVSSTVSSGSSNPHTSGTLSGLPDSLSRSLIKQASPIKVTTSRGPPSRSQSLEDTQTGPVNTASTLAHQTEPATSKAQDK